MQPVAYVLPRRQPTSTFASPLTSNAISGESEGRLDAITVRSISTFP